MKLQKEKKKFEGELEVLEKEYRDKDEEIKQTPEYKKLEREKVGLAEECENLEEKEGIILEEIRKKYTANGKRPSYSKSDYYYGMNIRKEVLNSIKRSLGIKNISLIKASAIEDIANRLIDEDIKNNKEIKEIRDKYSENGTRIGDIKKKQQNLNKPSDEIFNKISEVRAIIWVINNKLGKLTKLNDKNALAKEKRWKMKEEVEKKLKTNFDEIIKDVKRNVTKELIMTNLSENEED